VSTIEGMTAEQADKATNKIIAPYPNTYTFSKMLGEQVCSLSFPLQQQESAQTCVFF